MVSKILVVIICVLLNYVYKSQTSNGLSLVQEKEKTKNKVNRSTSRNTISHLKSKTPFHKRSSSPARLRTK